MRFSYYLASFLASAHSEVFWHKTKNGPSICATNKKPNTQIENGHFVVRIRVLGQQKHLFYKMNTQMHHFRVGPLQCNVWPSFAYLRICILGQGNHSRRFIVIIDNNNFFSVNLMMTCSDLTSSSSSFSNLKMEKCGFSSLFVALNLHTHNVSKSGFSQELSCTP